MTATALNPAGSLVSLSPCEFQTCSVVRQIRKQGAEAVFDAERAFAVFALLARLDLAAEVLGQELDAVADAQHRDAELEKGAVGQRRVLRIHARRAAGQDDALGLERGDFRGGRVVAQDHRIDVALADAARDDLRVLRTEIQDDNLLSHHGGLAWPAQLPALSGWRGAWPQLHSLTFPAAVVVEFHPERRGGQFGNVFLRNQFVQVFGIAALVHVEHLDGLVERGGVHRLDGGLLRFAQSAKVIGRRVQGTGAAGGGVGRRRGRVGLLTAAGEQQAGGERKVKWLSS